MYLGNLRHQTPPSWFPPILRNMLKFMIGTDFLAVEPGILLLPGISETHAYCSVQRYETRPARELDPEAHRLFADIHLIVRGREAIGWAPLRSGLPMKKPYDALNEIELFGDVPGERFIGLEEKDYLIADIDDIHRPRCSFESIESVVKVVGKIRSELLKA